ncbi:MAG: ABC transporter permease subunit [Candidatus Bathyarchaeia archaeon]
MRFAKAWIVASKDLSVFKKNKYITYSLVALPLLMGILIPGILIFSITAGASSINNPQMVQTAYMLIDMFTAYFVVIAAVLPTIIASYSFVGEKLEKSLEPLLATPTTDAELLFGKSLASFIPCIGATYIGTAIFVVIIDVWSSMTLGVWLLPNLYWAVVMGLMTPLACVLSVEANVIISSRVNDIRAAQQLGGLIILPLLMVMILATSIPSIPLVTLGLVVSGALAVADLALFYVAKATFRREEILTKWK